MAGARLGWRRTLTAAIVAQLNNHLIKAAGVAAADGTNGLRDRGNFRGTPSPYTQSVLATVGSAWQRSDVLRYRLAGTLGPRIVLIPLLNLSGSDLPGGLWVAGGLMSAVSGLTCPLYAVLVADDDIGLLAAVATATRFAVRRWWPLGWRVAVQLALTGFVVVYNVDVSHRGPSPLPAGPLPTLATSSYWSSSLGYGGSSGRHEGHVLRLTWPLSATGDNRWADEVAAAAAAVRQPPLAEDAIDLLTLLVGLYAVLSYSRIYLRHPVVASVDRRPGFAVVPVASTSASP